MPVTTIKVDSRLRDLLTAEARREGVTVGRVLEAMLEERARARRFAELKAAMAATPADLQQSYARETDGWAVTDADGVDRP